MPESSVRRGLAMALVVGLTVVRPMVGAGPSWPDASKNLALGKRYALSRRPNYGPCTNPDMDMIKLTDGKFAQGQRFWTAKDATVGFRTGLVKITVDLGREVPIEGVLFHTAGGTANVEPPAFVKVYAGVDGKTYSLVGEAYPEPTGQTGFRDVSINAPVRAKARYVAILAMSNGKYLFCDEIAIVKGAPETRTVTFDARVYEEEPEDAGSYPLSMLVVPIDFRTDGFNRKFVITERLSRPLYFDFRGDTTSIKRPELVLDLPKGFTVKGAYPRGSFYSSHYATYDCKSVEQGDRNIVRIDLGDTISTGVKLRRVRKYVYLDAAGCEPGVQGKMYIFLEDGNKQVAKKRACTLSVIAEIPPVRKPRHFTFGLCYSHSLLSPIDTVRKECREFFSNLGFSRFLISFFRTAKEDIAINKSLSDEGWEAGYMLGWGSVGPNFVKHFDISGMPHAVDRDGKQMNMLCHSAMLDGCEKVWQSQEARIRGTMNNFPFVKTVVLDYEPYHSSAPGTSCFCETCIGNFKRSAGIEKENLTSAEILKDHLGKWLSFRTRQKTALAKKVFDIVRNVSPAVTCVMCTAPLHSEAPGPSSSGLDPRDLEKFVDYSLPMIYCSGLKFFDYVKLNFNVMRKPVIPLIDPGEPVQSFFAGYDPKKVRMNMLAVAALGGSGIDFWPGDVGLDGEYLTYMAKAVGEIADVEDFYRRGKECTEHVWVKADVLKSLRYTAYRRRNKTLVTLFNYHLKNAVACDISSRGFKNKSIIVQPEDVELVTLEK